MPRKPTVPGLIRLLADTPIEVMEKAIVDGRAVDGFCREDGTIVIGLFGAKQWSRADSLVVTTIHELIHTHDDDLAEKTVRQMETEFFKSRVLREAVLMRLLNVVLFGE